MADAANRLRCVTGAIVGAIIGTTLGIILSSPTHFASTYAQGLAATQTTTSLVPSVGSRLPQPVLQNAVNANFMEEPLMMQPTEQPMVMSNGQDTGRTLPAFLGMAVILNLAAFAYYFRPKTIAAAAVTGERDEEALVGRRQGLAGAAAAISIASAYPSWAAIQAREAEKTYREETLALLEQMRAVVLIEKGDPTLVEKVTSLRPRMADWLAKYRNDDRFEGRTSFSSTSTAINALAGHWGDVGVNIVLSPKRATRVLRNISEAQESVPKGR